MKKFTILLVIFVLLISGCTTNKPQYITPDSAEFAPPMCVFYYMGKAYKSFIYPEGYDNYFNDVHLLPTNDTVEVSELKTIGTDYPDDYKLLTFKGKVYMPKNDNYSDIVFVKNEETNTFYPFINQNTPVPIIPQTAELSSDSYILDYNDKTFTSFYSQYGYNYYFSNDMRLIPTGDTVKVDKWITCGTGLPENYDPFAFNGEVFVIENDIYNGEFIFVYNKTVNVYYPFRCHINVPYNSGDTVRTYLNKRYGGESFDEITEVRLFLPNRTNEWYQLPEDIKDSLLMEIKNTSAEGSMCSCTHYTQSDKHRDLHFVLPVTRFEHTLTLCPNSSTVNGHKISKTLCDNILACSTQEYYHKTNFSRNKTE